MAKIISQIQLPEDICDITLLNLIASVNNLNQITGVNVANNNIPAYQTLYAWRRMV